MSYFDEHDADPEWVVVQARQMITFASSPEELLSGDLYHVLPFTAMFDDVTSDLDKLAPEHGPVEYTATLTDEGRMIARGACLKTDPNLIRSAA